MSYTARQLINGDWIVLEPDGLTWETWYRDQGRAERHAAALNAWLEAKPTTGEPELIIDLFEPVAPPRTPSCEELAPGLERILDRLAGPHDVRIPQHEGRYP